MPLPRIPHVFTLLAALILLVCLLTWIIPSGEYQRETRLIEGTERTLVIPGTYQTIPKSYSPSGLLIRQPNPNQAAPASLISFLTAIPRGLVQSADIVFYIFLIGGVFGILQATGTITAITGALLDRLGHSTALVSIVIMVLLAAGGSTLGMGEELIPLVPVFLSVSKRLGFDRIYGLALVFLSSRVGFAAATTNPFTVNIAQAIAELQLNSGIGFRLIFFAASVSWCLVYVLRYGAKLRRDPAASLLPQNTPDDDIDPATATEFRTAHAVIAACCLAVYAFILYAVQTMGWWLTDMAGGFLLMGLLAALIARLPPGEATRAFVKGMEGMVVAALVVGFARGIDVVLREGQILDTIIHAAATRMELLPRYLSVQAMFLFQTMFNFVVPSGSGQAAVTMPLMAPLSDVLGITRQTAVFAFQCGDGLSNSIIPTSGLLMAMLSLARIPYETWLRFALPIFLQLSALAAAFLAVAVAIGYR